ncbi:glycoside hydrolase family 65 protein [Actinomarinicola tropica]|uniref:Family 65 glycosyl hydrolase n=1 Tax=Actinomarinicola tropica TaxID=2789776 RepID=A0A5Q2RHU4_9ACTN|nr:glycosyl hydrolase family 65 protein [Actinomarinicola tropica]QGG94462.1 family 65 glycosyl hydrolase [Actinomarinicola tropica]
MIDPGAFVIDPWRLIEPELDLERLGHSESIFALSNGHIGLRGNLDEGEPHDTPGTYLNGFFETVDLPYAEGGYGYPELGQTLLNVTNGKHVRLLVDDEPFDVRYGTLERHVRTLDMRAGTLERDVVWTSPAGRTVEVRSTRLVSFVQRSIAVIQYEVRALDGPARVVLQSSLVANEPLPATSDDPRSAEDLATPLVCEYHTSNGAEVSLGHSTRESGLRMAAALDHLVEGPNGVITTTDVEDDLARVTFSTELRQGESLTLTKYLAYGWSASRSMPALRDQVDAAVAAASRVGWQGLLDEQRAYLDEVWDHADIEIVGDEQLQQAVRFALFQVIQASARAERRAIPAKGLSGRGYDGHTFWDMETYTLPALTYTLPHAARDALLWRHEAMPLAKERAEELSLPGVTFPWRTIRGEECSGYWPAGTAAFHINADVADAVRRYVHATDDREFESGAGLELLVETARLWAGLGHHDAEGNFRIDGVTGPDEYSAIADNNTFTNLMAARNLLAAADAADRHADRAAELDVDDEEVARWRRAARAVVIPYDEELGITPQSEGFTRYRRWDFDSTPEEHYPLLLHYPYYLLYSSQVVKQADLVFALYLFGELFPLEQRRRDFEYYERITVRDSSLSACIQAIVAADVGHLDMAYDYLRETALVDLRDQASNTAEGLHLASLAGSWLAVVAGFGGMRDDGETLAFSPRLPPQLQRICFRMLYRGRQLQVELSPETVRYTLRAGEAVTIRHHGEPIELSCDAPTEVTWTPSEPVPPVEPPSGREANRLGIGADAPDPIH